MPIVLDAANHKYDFTPINYNRLTLDDIMFGPDPRPFMELFLKIPTQNGLAPMILFPWMHEVACGGITHREMTLKAREVGSSTFWVAEKVRKVLTHPGSTLLIAANKEDNAKLLVGYAKSMIRNLPKELRPRITRDNDTLIELGDLGCSIKALSGTATSGRAERAKYLICTEMAFWGADGKTNPEAYWVAVTGALVEGGEIVIESTANTQADMFHDFWFDDDNGYRKHFYPWQANPTHHRVWYEQRAAEIKDRFMLLRDYPEAPEQAFTSASDTYFDAETILQGQSYVRPPIETRQIGMYGQTPGQVLVWKRPVVGRYYIVAADPAEGKKSTRERPDWSSAVILDARSYEHVASVHCRLDDVEFARVLVGVAEEYNRAQLVIERNGPGLAVIRVAESYGYTNMFKQAIQMRSEGRDSEVFESGWHTTPGRRPVMLADLYSVMKSNDLQSPDGGFWDEIKDISRQNARAMNGHDDRVFAMTIAVQAAKLYKPSAHFGSSRGGIKKKEHSWTSLFKPLVR